MKICKYRDTLDFQAGAAADAPAPHLTTRAMSADICFSDFADRLLAGEDAAAREHLGQYSAQLIRLARRRIGPRP